jgi:heat shock protein HtpX
MTPFFRTALLMAAMTALFVGLGGVLGGTGGAAFALIAAGVMNLVTWWNSDRMVLRMHGAQPLPPGSHDLKDLVEDLAHRAQMPVPRVYVMTTDQPNAFATGRDPEHAAVAVTTGLLKSMSR